MKLTHAFCPMGCGDTLFVGAGGQLTCCLAACPRPDAAAAVLANRETEHVIILTDDGYTTKHPLRERIEDDLFTCTVHERIGDELSSGEGAHLPLGKYRVTEYAEGRLKFDALP